MAIDQATQRETRSFERAERLAVAEASPRMVAAHDRDGWYALFARGAAVEDPVGTPPCRKGYMRRGLLSAEDELLGFYDAFIGSNDIRFDVHQDVVVGLTVARDVTIHARMPTGFTSSVPAYLLYELELEDGALRVGRLAAHWEVSANAKQTSAAGLRGTASMLYSMTWMLRHLGPAGTREYVRGTRTGVRRPGRQAAQALAKAIEAGDRGAIEGLVTARASVQVGDREDVPLRSLLDTFPGFVLRVKDLVAGGYTVSGRCEVTLEGRVHQGLAFFDFDRPTRTIHRARLLFEE
jgi:hypothetical protein